MQRQHGLAADVVFAAGCCRKTPNRRNSRLFNWKLSSDGSADVPWNGRAGAFDAAGRVSVLHDDDSFTAAAHAAFGCAVYFGICHALRHSHYIVYCNVGTFVGLFVSEAARAQHHCLGAMLLLAALAAWLHPWNSVWYLLLPLVLVLAVPIWFLLHPAKPVKGGVR